MHPTVCMIVPLFSSLVSAQPWYRFFLYQKGSDIYIPKQTSIRIPIFLNSWMFVFYTLTMDKRIQYIVLPYILLFICGCFVLQRIGWLYLNDAISVLKSTAIQRGLVCNMRKMMQQDDFKSLVNWTTVDELGPKMSIANCNLNVIDREFARMVIRHAAPNGLLIIGDSLSRYQYLNLVNFLEHGTWVTDPTHLKPSENEKKFDGGWKEFYQITNQRLRGHEICDCFRDGGEILENRYYIHEGVKVSYLQLFGSENPVMIHNTQLMNISSCLNSSCVQSFCQPGDCAPSLLPVEVIGTILQPHTLSRMIASVAPSQVLLNLGLWWIEGGVNVFPVLGNQTLMDEVKIIKQDNPNIKMHWKMTTASKHYQPPEIEFARHMVTSGGFESFYDTHALTNQVLTDFPLSLMWDAGHFEPLVYSELNRALIAYLWSLNNDETNNE